MGMGQVTGICWWDNGIGRIQLPNKPYGVICQFSRVRLHSTRADYIALPVYYPAGQLERQRMTVAVDR
jgi:16S rRNA U516 pseudouridylate synthase RsuA-like enzyme